MKGIRKKINSGFVILIILLLFSGMVSLFELNRFTNHTQALLESNYHNIELSKRMLDAVEKQNVSLLQMILLDAAEYDSAYIEGGTEFDLALTEAAAIEAMPSDLDPVVEARDRYRSLVDRYFDTRYDTDATWFLDMYKTSYGALTTAIKEYMADSQYSLVSRASQLENNAYRAIMPGIITLVIAILIVLMFMYLIGMYYTRPVVRMQKALNDYLRHNVPFDVTTEGPDEITRLREDIETLIHTAKIKKTE